MKKMKLLFACSLIVMACTCFCGSASANTMPLTTSGMVVSAPNCASLSDMEIYYNGRFVGSIRSNGDVYINGRNVGRVNSSGDIYVNGRREGEVRSNGDIYKDGRRVGEVRSNGEVYKDGRRVGEIRSNGDIYKDGRNIGRVNFMIKPQWAAIIYFFGFFDL